MKFEDNTLTAFIVLLFIILAGCAGNNALIKKKSQAFEDLGTSLIQQGDLRGGLEKLLEASKLDPQNADLHNQIGLAYTYVDLYKESLTHFKKALYIQPNFPEAQNNLGTLYLLMKDWDSAIACFQKAVSNATYKTPHFAYNNMGLAYYNKGDYIKAIASYQKALHSFPSYVACYDNLGRAYEASSLFQEAIDSYKTSLSYEPNYPISRFNLALLLLKLNRRDEAAAELRLTMQKDPNGPYGKRAKELLKEIE